MYDSPISLKEICLETICNNLYGVFELYYESEEKLLCSSYGRNERFSVLLKRYRFKNSDLYLFNEISESILAKLDEKNLVCDSTINLFTAKNTKLKNIKIRNASKLTYDGLKVLRDHKIVGLECIYLRSVCVNKIIGCLGDWTVQNITYLNISQCTFVESAKNCLLAALAQLKNLRSLNVSYTEFNQASLELVCQCLRFLEKLDMSGTFVEDFTPLLFFAEQLTSLTVADYKLTKYMAAIIVRLNSLRYLDISVSDEKVEISDSRAILEILGNYNALPRLISLDLSGWREYLQTGILERYIMTHPQLRYVGLVLNLIVFEAQFINDKHPNFNNNLIIAGIGNETQIKVTLRKHYQRACYVQKALYYLFQLTSEFQEARSDIFELILPAMAAHPKKFGVQMAATACLYNLTRGDFSKNIHPRLLGKAVNLTLTAMEQFPEDTQLQKNSLLILCSDRILQEVTFARFRCAKLVLNSLCNYDDCNMNRMAVAICSILAAKVSTNETSELGAHPEYMHKLLAMVESRVETKTSDLTMKFTLSALWNLTDESAATCAVFLDQGGAGLFLKVLKTFQANSVIKTKVLGLLNNIAEVEILRHNLMVNALIEELHILLKSALIDVSYFAAGIVAHLASDGPEYWTIYSYTRDEMLEELESVVSKWYVPDGEIVAYRSFKPFLPLLRKDMDYRVQLWAVWAINHVCTKNPTKYCVMLQNEMGVELLRNLIENKSTHSNIRHLSEQILNCLNI